MTSTDLVKGTAAKAGTALTTTTDDAFEAAVITAVDAGTQTAAADQNADLKALIVSETAKIGTGLSTSALATVNKNIASATAALAAIGTADEVAAVAKKTSTDITNRMEVNVAASFEASNGITYGGKMRVRSDGGNAHFNAPQFSAAMGGVSLVVGNNNGQMYKAAVSDSNVGLTSLGFRTYVVGGFDEYSSCGTGPQGVDLNYTSAGFSAGVSHSKTTESTQAGVSYSVGALSLGASTQDGKAAADDMSAVSVGYSFDGGSISAAYGENNGTKKTRVGGSFDVGAATSMTAFVLDTNEAGVKNTYGLGVSHDLGGASLKAGYVKHDTGSAADFGIVFNF